MEEADKSVLESDLLHYLHSELVLVSTEVGGSENGSHFVLSGSYLIVLGLGVDTELPELLIEVSHISGNSRLEVGEVLVIEVLTLGGLCAEESSSGEDEVFTLVELFLIYEEVFLLGSDSRSNAGNVLVAEELEEADSGLAEGVHRAEQRSFLIERLTCIGNENSGDIEAALLDEAVGGRIPRSIASCGAGLSETARRE